MLTPAMTIPIDFAWATMRLPMAPQKTKRVRNHLRPQKSQACETMGHRTTVRMVMGAVSQLTLSVAPKWPEMAWPCCR